ncbi:MAG: hypothetical protein LBT01_04250 [Spirochaetaceae bacterium]|jgi:chromosome segregation ATPase|nr:hypothetical protein [Spirochaetaceae bacterium]
MNNLPVIIALLKDLGTPAICVAGFAWLIYIFKKLDTKFSVLEAKFSGLEAKFSGLEAKFSVLEAKFLELEAKFLGLEAKFSGLEAKFSGLEAKFSRLALDIKSIKGNHLPHIEAAIKALAKGTSNEEHVKEILDLSREVELKTADNEQETANS